METTENNKPNCAIKCLRNAEDVSHSVHALKYGVVCNYVLCIHIGFKHETNLFVSNISKVICIF